MVDTAMPAQVWVWITQATSGLAIWIALWITKPARLTPYSMPSTNSGLARILPSWSILIRLELGQELTASFCRTDPAIARQFARTTFLSDTREELSSVSVPTLVLQCSSDVIAPVEVGEYVAAAIPDSTLQVLAATGHCPNLSAPEETVAAISSYVRAPAA